MMTILVIGVGYVGLVTGACLSEMGNHVICLDIDQKKIELLKRGEIPIHEPGLKEMVHRNQKAKRLRFTTDFKEGMKRADVCMLALPTPPNEDGSTNLSFIRNTAKEIGQNISRYLIVVNKSTTPVGTAQEVKTIIQKELDKRGEKIPFNVVSNPEFLKEGAAVQDCMSPDRIIIGSDSPKAIKIMRDIYHPFTLNHDRFLIMDIPSAEMTKYAANSMLALRISFMNELAKICEVNGADINQVRIGIGSDRRIGYHFLYAGLGFGGSCLPKDLSSLRKTAENFGLDTPLLNATATVNENQKKFFIQKIDRYFEKKGGLSNKTIAIWGLSFKPNTDDIREAPIRAVIDILLEKGAILRLFDPIAIENTKKEFGSILNITFCNSEYDAANAADAVILATEWRQFRVVNFERVLRKMKGSAFFDGRNQYDPTFMQEQGFDYYGIGTSTQKGVDLLETLKNIERSDTKYEATQSH